MAAAVAALVRAWQITLPENEIRRVYQKLKRIFNAPGVCGRCGVIQQFTVAECVDCDTYNVAKLTEDSFVKDFEAIASHNPDFIPDLID